MICLTFLWGFLVVLGCSFRQALDLFIDVVQLVITMYAYCIQINIVCSVKTSFFPIISGATLYFNNDLVYIVCSTLLPMPKAWWCSG